MKKLKLNLSSLPGAEILTRVQMKKVMGGMYSGGDPKCGGTCWGGDHLPWTADCELKEIFKGFFDCRCPNSTANGGNCKLS